MKQEIRVLVVDDSAVIRAMICDLVGAAPGILVVGKARDGVEAMQKIATLKPDVVTLDIQMPNMDGLAVLDKLLQSNPVPVIMVSSLTRAGAAITLDALERGAVDYVAKPDKVTGKDSTAFGEELVLKIRGTVGINVRRMMDARRRRNCLTKTLERPVVKVSSDACPPELIDRCVALGISTGGPPVLTRLMAEFRPPMPPIVVVQHMPPQFTKLLAIRLNSLSALSVTEAEAGDLLRPNCVFIAPGGKHLEVMRFGHQVKVHLRDGEVVSGHKPSADVMMESAAKAFGPNCLGVIMTGMGRDGANGCKAIRAAGGYVLGQDEDTSDVYGMNKVAFVEGNVDQQIGLQEAALAITRRVRQLGRETANA
jgi:two-component system, chemotaxis family, protein-glutamate methylesterase/glutaminase